MLIVSHNNFLYTLHILKSNIRIRVVQTNIIDDCENLLNVAGLHHVFSHEEKDIVLKLLDVVLVFETGVISISI